MKLPSEKKVLEYLKDHLSRERLGHTMAVTFLAEKLARRHGLSVAKARMAGLLHDSAKEWSVQELKACARKKNLQVPDLKETLQHPRLIHAYAGAHVAEKEFGIRNQDILSAIRKHTLADVKMSTFDKCVFLADLASPDRKFPEARAIRALAMKSLDKGFAEGLRIKLMYAVMKGRWFHPHSQRVWNRWRTDA